MVIVGSLAGVSRKSFVIQLKAAIVSFTSQSETDERDLGESLLRACAISVPESGSMCHRGLVK